MIKLAAFPLLAPLMAPLYACRLGLSGTKGRLLMGAVVWLFASVVQASCYKIEGLSGYSAKGWSGYKFESDAISKSLYVVIDGEDSFVSDSEMVCRPFSDAAASLVCIYMDGAKSTVEAWNIDPQEGRVLYTKNIQGYGEYDGVVAFVGSAESCD